MFINIFIRNQNSTAIQHDIKIFFTTVLKYQHTHKAIATANKNSPYIESLYKFRADDLIGQGVKG